VRTLYLVEKRINMSDLQYDVICVGAGFSGLSAAHTLLKSRPGLKVCVLEAKGKYIISIM